MSEPKVVLSQLVNDINQEIQIKKNIINKYKRMILDLESEIISLNINKEKIEDKLTYLESSVLYEDENRTKEIIRFKSIMEDLLKKV